MASSVIQLENMASQKNEEIRLEVFKRKILRRPCKDAETEEWRII